MRMHADAEESRQKLQATRKKMLQQSPQSNISSRLGGRVGFVTGRDNRNYEDYEEDDSQQRMSVKERLGIRRDSAAYRCKCRNN